LVIESSKTETENTRGPQPTKNHIFKKGRTLKIEGESGEKRTEGKRTDQKI